MKLSVRQALEELVNMDGRDFEDLLSPFLIEEYYVGVINEDETPYEEPATLSLTSTLYGERLIVETKTDGYPLELDYFDRFDLVRENIYANFDYFVEQMIYKHFAPHDEFDQDSFECLFFALGNEDGALHNYEWIPEKAVEAFALNMFILAAPSGFIDTYFDGDKLREYVEANMGYYYL